MSRSKVIVAGPERAGKKALVAGLERLLLGADAAPIGDG